MNALATGTRQHPWVSWTTATLLLLLSGALTWAQTPDSTPTKQAEQIDWLNVARELGFATEELKGRSPAEVKRTLQHRVAQETPARTQHVASAGTKQLAALIPYMLRADHSGDYDVAALWFRPEFWSLVGEVQAPTFKALFATGALFGVARLEDLLPSMRRKAGSQPTKGSPLPANLAGTLEVAVGQTRTLLQGKTVGWLQDFVSVQQASPADPFKLFRATRLLWFPLTDGQGNEVNLPAAREVKLTLRDVGGARVRRFRWERLPADWNTTKGRVIVAGRQGDEKKRVSLFATNLNLASALLGEPARSGPNGARIWVIGAVGMPGCYGVGPGQTIEQIIKLAGNPRPDADLANVLLLRDDGKVHRVALHFGAGDTVGPPPAAPGATVAWRRGKLRAAPASTAGGMSVPPGTPVMVKPAAPATGGAALAGNRLDSDGAAAAFILRPGDVIIVPPRR